MRRVTARAAGEASGADLPQAAHLRTSRNPTRSTMHPSFRGTKTAASDRFCDTKRVTHSRELSPPAFSRAPLVQLLRFEADTAIAWELTA